MTGEKLQGRMEEGVWEPPVLSFTVERHGGTVQGSSRASLQQWRLDLGDKTARCVQSRFRQVRPPQPRFDVGRLAEEVASAICQRRDDQRLKWHREGRVRVLIGKVLRFRAALRQWLAAEGWQEAGVHVYVHGPGGRASTEQMNG
jgi:hypothetical protein